MSFERVTQQKKILIPPYYLGNLLSGIERQLNDKIMCYSEEMNGIVISYDNVQVIGNTSDIIDDNPFILIDAEVDFLVLKFIKTNVIKGTITKFAKTTIDLLVYNTFNAQINIPQFMDNERFTRSYLKIGQQITFEISQYLHYHKKKMIQIKGALPKQSNIGIFDDNQNFISIIDILKGKIEIDTKHEQIVPQEDSDDDYIKSEDPQEESLAIQAANEEIEVIESTESAKKKKSKKKDKKSKKKSKREKKDKKKKKKKRKHSDDDDAHKRKRKRRKIET